VRTSTDDPGSGSPAPGDDPSTEAAAGPARAGAPGRHLALLVNPTAGGGRARGVAAAAAAHLADRGAGCTTVDTRDRAHAARATEEALGRGEVPVAVGGDGMLRIVAGVAAGRQSAAVGVIPAGRGNDFARFLGLPTDTRAAADALLDGVVVPVDTGLARGADGVERTFLSIVSVGFDSEANRIANEAPARLGGLVYVWGVFGALAGLRPIPLVLRHDGTERHPKALLIAVANAGAYGGGMHMAPDASVSDGLLDVVVVRHHGRHADRCDVRDRGRLLRFVPGVFRGTHVDSRHVDVDRTAEIDLAADGPLEAYADGDPIGRLPMTVRVRPGSLRLLVPASRVGALTRAAGPAVTR
jgi:YegS/Rv2252/BmrU family lipid kinase